MRENIYFNIKAKSLKGFWEELYSTSAIYWSPGGVFIELNDSGDKSYLHLTKMGPQNGHRIQLNCCATEYPK